MFRSLTAALLGATALAALAIPSGAEAQTVNRWIQLAPDNKVLARAITTATACPALHVNGLKVKMEPRSTPSTGFPVLECEAVIPHEEGEATIDGVRLKLPVPDPKRIVIVGDTGCRIKGTAIQACNDPTAFPLARLSSYVAAFRPDLIVHVGDYYYREAPCPAGTTIDCAGSPYGDNWASWNADWFSPGNPMMLAAPMAFTRGNHESCARGQQGWFTLLDPRTYDANAVACAADSTYDMTPPYVLKAGPVDLLMFDSSYANDSAVDGPTLSVYQSQLAAILPTLKKPTVFVTHKPSYGLISSSGSGASETVSGGNDTEQVLFANGVPQPIQLLLSGHIHNFQAVQLTSENYAPQLVVGDSGTLLDPDYVPANAAGGAFVTSAGNAPTIVKTSDVSEFGFVVLDQVPGGYLANLYDLNGTPHGRCVIGTLRRTLVCSVS